MDDMSTWSDERIWEMVEKDDTYGTRRVELIIRCPKCPCNRDCVEAHVELLQENLRLYGRRGFINVHPNCIEVIR